MLGSVTEQKLPPAALDLVIMVNVVHCLAEPVATLKNVGGSLKPNGMIAIKPAWPDHPCLNGGKRLK